MAGQPHLCSGELRGASTEGAIQTFTLYRVADDAVDLVFDASGTKVRIQVERIAGYEIKRAIEKKLGGEVSGVVGALGF